MKACGKLKKVNPMKDRKLKIVYIEDDLDTQNLVNLILSRKGFEVKGVSDSQQGIDLITHEEPDLILLDLMLPEIDGWEVYRRLKKNKNTKNIPVIIITAKAQPIDKVLGLQIAKVDDYICKPFIPEELLQSINKVLAKIST
jgi:two-component system, OmpR family, response regulator VicR